MFMILGGLIMGGGILILRKPHAADSFDGAVPAECIGTASGALEVQGHYRLCSSHYHCAGLRHKL